MDLSDRAAAVAAAFLLLLLLLAPCSPLQAEFKASQSEAAQFKVQVTELSATAANLTHQLSAAAAAAAAAKTQATQLKTANASLHVSWAVLYLGVNTILLSTALLLNAVLLQYYCMPLDALAC
jgi:hypothetical protein